ncbi:hypothetical protein [Granulicella paludicola]|uniref:hypothetical protein n=1 Tax=Granulicella paludicola TaxID=474951 RepID=UPI0021E0BD60|nr:hypothetical protein [Granulicella paludicola]
MNHLPTTEEEMTSFLAAFETGALPKERWTHGAHLLGGAWYVHLLGEEAALKHMRGCVQRYNVAVGGQNTPTSGYNETVTAFWIKLLNEFLKSRQPMARSEFVNLAVTHFEPQRDIYARYYDFDVIASIEARVRWIPPNLAALNGE